MYVIVKCFVLVLTFCVQDDELVIWPVLAQQLQEGTPIIYICNDIVKASAVIYAMKDEDSPHVMYLHNQIVVCPDQGLAKYNRQGAFQVCF